MEADVPGKEIIFRSDHRFTGRNGSHILSGTWRLESERLITIVTSSSTGKERIYKCTFQISGEKLTFRIGGAVTESNGQQIGEPQIYMNSTSYQRVR